MQEFDRVIWNQLPGRQTDFHLGDRSIFWLEYGIILLYWPGTNYPSGISGWILKEKAFGIKAGIWAVSGSRAEYFGGQGKTLFGKVGTGGYFSLLYGIRGTKGLDFNYFIREGNSGKGNPTFNLIPGYLKGPVWRLFPRVGPNYPFILLRGRKEAEKRARPGFLGPGY